MSDFQSITEIIEGVVQDPPQLLAVSVLPMTAEEILTWGEQHFWPQLVPDRKNVLRHGETAWQELTTSGDYARLLLVSQRIERWNKLVKSGK